MYNKRPFGTVMNEIGRKVFLLSVKFMVFVTEK